jgi:serine/threonine protein kinase
LDSSVVLVAIRPFSRVAELLLGRSLVVEFVVNSKRFRSSSSSSVTVVLQIRSVLPTSIFSSRATELIVHVESLWQVRNDMSQCSEVMIGATALALPCVWITNTSIRVSVSASDSIPFSALALPVQLWDGSKLFKSTANSGILVFPKHVEAAPSVVEASTSLQTYLIAFGISLGALFIVTVVVFLKQRQSKLKLKQLVENRKDSSYDGLCQPIDPSAMIFAEQEAVREGYFGTIFKAVWSAARGVDVVVAVKQRNVSQCLNWDMTLFHKIVQDSVSLQHPNCVRLLGFSNQVDLPQIVMEWIENGSIADLLEKGEPVPPHFRLRMAREISQGLSYLHCEKRLTHGSIKNRNILVAQDGTAKIGDRIFSEIQRHCVNSSPHEMVRIDCDTGFSEALALESLAFVSPELLARRYKHDYRNMISGSCIGSESERVSMPEDVYAFGVILWTLMNWKTPFDGMTESHIKSYISEGTNVPLPVPSPLPSGFSQDFVDLMMLCLDRNPALRPTSEILCRRLRAIDPSTRPVEPIEIFPPGFVSDKTSLLDCMLAALPSERSKLESMIEKIIDFHSTNEGAIKIIRECGLSAIEAQSISMYTFSIENGFTWQTSPFFIYNKALRLLDFETIAAWQDYSYFLISGLKKLPSIRRKVWRGLNLRLTQISHLYQKGSQV